MPRLSALLIGIAALVAGALSGCGAITLQEQVTTFDVTHVPRSGVEVRTHNGAVVVRREDREQVSVTARLSMSSEQRLQDTTIVAQHREGALRIEAQPAGGRWQSREGCSFEIVVPDADGVNITTGNGRIEISGLEGDATLRTSNGRIEARAHDGDISATTSNGRVRLVDFTGSASVHTSNGAVVLSPAAGSTGPLNVRTSNGAVTINVPVVEGTTALAGQMEMRTSNGSITIDTNVNAQLQAKSRRAATISFGAGGALSQIRTSNGSVTVKAVAGGS